AQPRKRPARQRCRRNSRWDPNPVAPALLGLVRCGDRRALSRRRHPRPGGRGQPECAQPRRLAQRHLPRLRRPGRRQRRLRALPGGGSMRATAVNVAPGAAPRWAALLAGLWMGVTVIAFPAAVSQIAMPALGALLILAGISSLKPGDAAVVANAGWPSILAA